MERKSHEVLRGILPVLAAISLAGGPITWTAHTSCQARLSEIELAGARVHVACDSQNPEKPEPRSPDAGASFVSACSAKPADGDSSAVGLIFITCDATRELKPVCRAYAFPKSSPPARGLHRPPFQSQAPPALS